jgi:hypothetical protein
MTLALIKQQNRELTLNEEVGKLTNKGMLVLNMVSTVAKWRGIEPAELWDEPLSPAALAARKDVESVLPGSNWDDTD